MTLQHVNTTVCTSPQAMLYTAPVYTGSILENVMMTGVPEEEARRVCDELISAYTNDEEVSCNDSAQAHYELMTELLEVIMDDNRKPNFLNNEAYDIDYEPFQSTPKAKDEEIEHFVHEIQTDYYCTICQMNHVASSGEESVQLLCGEQCIFCKDCISTWLKMSVARCPNCNHTFKK